MHWDGSSVMFPLGSLAGGGSCNIRPPCPNDSVGIDLMPTPISAAKLCIFHARQMTAEIALFMGITFKFWPFFFFFFFQSFYRK